MSKYNFAQYVGFFVAGQDLALKLTLGWSTAKAPKGKQLVIVTQPSVRRAMGIMETPLKVTINAQDERLQAVLAKNSVTNAAHRGKFDLQAEHAKQAKQGIALLRTIAELIGS